MHASPNDVYLFHAPESLERLSCIEQTGVCAILSVCKLQNTPTHAIYISKFLYSDWRMNCFEEQCPHLLSQGVHRSTSHLRFMLDPFQVQEYSCCTVGGIVCPYKECVFTICVPTEELEKTPSVTKTCLHFSCMIGVWFFISQHVIFSIEFSNDCPLYLTSKLTTSFKV